MPSSLETRPDATPHDSARSLFFSSLSSAIDAPWALRRSAKSIRQSVLAFQINSASSVPRRRRESGRETLEAWVFAVQLVWDYEPVSPFGRLLRRACFRPLRPISSASSSVTSRTIVPLRASLNLIVNRTPFALRDLLAGGQRQPRRLTARAELPDRRRNDRCGTCVQLARQERPWPRRRLDTRLPRRPRGSYIQPRIGAAA